MKKILALVLALVLALGTFSFAAAAPADVEGTDYEDAVVRLGALDIIEGFPDGTYRPDQPVTRAQFAKIIVSALGVGEAANYATGTTKFSDVPVGHWAAGYINVAVDVGVIAGYPDGTFKPENPVTFAEAIKMIVAALGYTPKADALGGYPGGYLAVAAEKDITKGVSVVSALTANRGDIALMVDNALDVPLMVQKTYGQYPEYQEDEDKTLLTAKLGVDEVKGVVTGVPLSDSKLKDDEIKINGKEYTAIVDMDLNYFFGLEVKAWADDDDVFFIEIDTDEDDILHDTVVASNRNEIKLYVEDDEFDWARNADVYINFEDADPEDLSDGMYGRAVFDDDGEVRFASFFRFGTVLAGVVAEMDDDVYELVTADGGEEEIDLEDYDDGVFVFGPQFQALDVEDIDVDSAVFAWEDDDELYVIVVNGTEEGTLDRVRDDSFRLDGTVYDVARDGCAFSDDGKDSFSGFTTVDDLDNLGGEEVTLVFDLNGEVLFVYGDAEATSGWMYGIVTYGSLGRHGEAAVFTQNGKEVDYDFERRQDAIAVDFGDSYFQTDATGLKFAAIKYKVNKYGEISEIGAAELPNQIKVVDYNIFPVAYDALTKGAEKRYVMVGTDRYYINSSTVFMAALNSDGELDPKVLDYDDIYDIKIDAYNEVVVFGKAGETAKLVVFLDKEFEGTAEDIYYGVVTDRPWKEHGEWLVSIDVFDEGQNEYLLDDPDDFQEGDVVAFRMNSDREAVLIAPGGTVKGVYAGDVPEEMSDGNYKDGYLTTDNGKFMVDAGAVVYALEDDGEIDGKVSRTRMDRYDHIWYVVDKNEAIVAVAVQNKEEAGDGGSGGVSGIAAEFINSPIIVYEGTAYKVETTTLLYDRNGNILVNGTDMLSDPYKTALGNLKADITPSGNVDSSGNPILGKIKLNEYDALSFANSTVEVVPVLDEDVTSTVTIRIEDTLDSYMAGEEVTIRIDVDVINNDSNEDEVYVVDGQTTTDDVVITKTANTNEDGAVTFMVTLPPGIDGGDGISIEISAKLADGSFAIVTGSPLGFTK